jgi:excisionase family DNA binding protein
VKGEREYMTPAEVARLLHVSPKTVVRWTNAGHIPAIVTLGGHRRFQRADIEALAAKMASQPETPTED